MTRESQSEQNSKIDRMEIDPKQAGLEMLQKMYRLDATKPGDEKIEEGESKYRKRRFFGNVLFSFWFLKPYITDQALRAKIDQVKKEWTDPVFTARSRPTKEEDIKQADELIVEVLRYFGIKV